MGHTAETKKKISESVRRSHALQPRSEESRAKSSASLKQCHAEGRAGGYAPGNKLGARRKPESVKRAHDACMAVVVGSHGFGCMERGKQDHLFAKTWTIESPDGVRFECANLLEWCRQNEHLLPQDEVRYKQPLWRRAAMGIGKQASSKDPRNQWRGWRLIWISASGRVISTIGVANSANSISSP